jgi:predicted DNA-binding transcriptional regulator AlpA
MTERLLTLAEAQTVLGIGKTKMYELINDGEIETVDVSAGEPKPARRIGDKGPRPSRRVAESEIQRYIDRNRVPAP